MVFSSIPFLFYFLPCVLILYFAVPKKLKNVALLLASILFYGWGEPKFLLLMLLSVFQGWLFGIWIEKSEGRRAKILLAASVIFSVAMLGVFKYADFFIANFNAVTGLSVPLLRMALPIGISFYTFQILSYTVDVYRRTVPSQRNPIHLAAYVMMFPQLIAGPIVRYSDIAAQLAGRTHTIPQAAQGTQRFLLGLGKKVLLANTLGELCGLFRETQDSSVLFVWLYALAYALHVYFDFSGYSDMAIGLGKLFGFDFPENFRYPYCAKSITEFWRRWHISLGSWFRDYVYIPMGGNRVSRLRWLFNLLVVWLLTGFWHGASWNFVLWGLFFGVLLMIEKLFLGKWLAKSVVLGRVYVLFAVLLSFVLFDAASVSDAIATIGSMFGVGGLPLVSTEALYYLRSYGVLLILGVLGATPLLTTIMTRLRNHRGMSRVLSIAEPVGLLVMFAVVTAYLVDGSFNPFLYFRF